MRNQRSISVSIPNSPYCFLPFLPIHLLRLIGVLLGGRCNLCEEGMAVFVHVGRVYDWLCLQCVMFQLPDDVHLSVRRDSSLTSLASIRRLRDTASIDTVEYGDV
jgi:hypothetical protein